jgi:predicted O-methyltransferase YrrM
MAKPDRSPRSSGAVDGPDAERPGTERRRARRRSHSTLRRRRVLIAAGVAVAALLAVVLVLVEPSVAGIAAAAAVVSLVVLYVVRGNARALARLERDMRRRGRAHERRERRRTRALVTRLAKAGVARDRQQFAQIEALSWLIHVLPLAYSLRPTRGFASSPDLLLLLVRLIDEHRPALVLELGSGVSTIVMAARLKALGTGSIITVDHEATYAEQARRELALHGLSDVATVFHAPLADVVLPTGTFSWYDLPDGVPPNGVDLLFVDGPPGTAGELARYPALPILGARLSPGAVIVMDDTTRPEEVAAVSRWHADVPGSTLELLPLESGAAILTLPTAT